jgi:hypothetical protein
MGLLDVFKRSRGTLVLGPRQFTLVIAGHGIEARPRMPIAAAHLSDGTLVFGPFDLPAARSSGQIRTLLINPGSAPTTHLAPHSISDNSIVTYSSAERGTTHLVLSTGMRDHSDILEAVSIGAHPAIWRIVTDQIDCWWPAGFSLRATGDTTAPEGPIHLAHEGSSHDAIHLFGPLIGENIPSPERLHGGNGTRIDAGSLEGAMKPIKHYTFEGDASALRYYFVHLDTAAIYLVRARASIDKAATVFKAADVLCASLKPRF